MQGGGSREKICGGGRDKTICGEEADEKSKYVRVGVGKNITCVEGSAGKKCLGEIFPSAPSGSQ